MGPDLQVNFARKLHKSQSTKVQGKSPNLKGEFKMRKNPFDQYE